MMKPFLLAAALVALSSAAHAGAVGQTRCWGVYGGTNCESRLDTPDATTTTQCMFRERGGSGCATERADKRRPKPPEPPRPVKAPTTEIGVGGIRVMRGMPE